MEQIIIKTSLEIDIETWELLLNLHNRNYDLSLTIENYLQYYKNNTLGYCFHAIAIANDNLIGHLTFKPQEYYLNNNLIFGVLGGGSVIDKNYRSNEFLYYDLHSQLKSYVLKLDYKFIIGIPNKNLYNYAIKLLKNKHIGSLNFYILPVNSNFFINHIWKFGEHILEKIFRMKNSSNHSIYLKKDLNYLNTRYNSSVYKTIKKGNQILIYRIVKEGKLNILYLFESLNENVFNKYVFLSCLFEIREHSSFDFVLVIGTIKRFNFSFTVPQKWKPKELPIVMEVLQNASELEKIQLYNFRNWEFELSNFDVK